MPSGIGITRREARRRTRSLGCWVPGLQHVVSGFRLAGRSADCGTTTMAIIRIVALPDGTYTVTFSLAYHYPDTRANVALPEGRTETVDGVVTPGKKETVTASTSAR